MVLSLLLRMELAVAFRIVGGILQIRILRYLNSEFYVVRSDPFCRQKVSSGPTGSHPGSTCFFLQLLMK